MAVDRVGFKVEGLSAVVRDLKALGVDVNDLKDAFARIASEGAQVVQSRVPRLSGVLAGSVRGNRAQSKAVVSAGGARVPYAGVINYGWPRRGISAQPFMQSADAAMGPRAIVLLDGEINSAIRRRGLG